MPRGVFLLGVGLLLVAGAFLVTCAALGPAPGVTEANVRRIRQGMALAEVESILGGRGKIPVGYGAPTLRMWEGDAGVALVRVTHIAPSGTTPYA